MTLGPVEPGGILQNLPTTASTLYTLDFWVTNCPNLADCTLNSFSVDWGGSTVYSQTNGPPTPWIHVVIPNLLASGALTELRFIGSNDISFFLLDDIRVEALDATAVPEPTTMALLGTGFAALVVR